MSVESTIVAAVTLGLAYAALPGVVNTEALRRGISHGFRSAAAIQVGALIGDAGWAVVALTGAALLLQNETVAFALGLLGAGFLFHLARAALMSAVRGPSGDVATARTGGSLFTGVVFSIANPAGLAFWTGIGGGMLGTEGGQISMQAAAAFLAAFLAAAVTWGIGMSALVSWGRRFATPRMFRAIDALCGLALGWFGVRLLWVTLQRYGRWLPLAARTIA